MRACEGRLGREPKGTGTARLAVGKRQPPLQPRPARRRHAQPPPWIGTAVRGVWPRSFPCIPGTGSIWFQHCWIHAHLATRTFTRSPTACECPAPVKKQASWTTQRPLGTREKWRPDEAQRRLQRREGQAHQRPPHPPPLYTCPAGPEKLPPSSSRSFSCLKAGSALPSPGSSLPCESVGLYLPRQGGRGGDSHLATTRDEGSALRGRWKPNTRELEKQKPYSTRELGAENKSHL